MKTCTKTPHCIYPDGHLGEACYVHPERREQQLGPRPGERWHNGFNTVEVVTVAHGSRDGWEIVAFHYGDGAIPQYVDLDDFMERFARTEHGLPLCTNQEAVEAMRDAADSPEHLAQMLAAARQARPEGIEGRLLPRECACGDSTTDPEGVCVDCRTVGRGPEHGLPTRDELAHEETYRVGFEDGRRAEREGTVSPATHRVQPCLICGKDTSVGLSTDPPRVYKDGWHHKACLDEHMEGRFVSYNQPPDDGHNGRHDTSCPECNAWRERYRAGDYSAYEVEASLRPEGRLKAPCNCGYVATSSVAMHYPGCASLEDGL